MLLAGRRLLQTLLVGMGCGGVLGLLPGPSLADRGKHSPRLGIPGLYDSALSGLVWHGEEWWKRMGFLQESAEFLGCV